MLIGKMVSPEIFASFGFQRTSSSKGKYTTAQFRIEAAFCLVANRTLRLKACLPDLLPEHVHHV